jgi:hypothetical protein
MSARCPHRAQSLLPFFSSGCRNRAARGSWGSLPFLTLSSRPEQRCISPLRSGGIAVSIRPQAPVFVTPASAIPFLRHFDLLPVFTFNFQLLTFNLLLSFLTKTHKFRSPQSRALFLPPAPLPSFCPLVQLSRRSAPSKLIPTCACDSSNSSACSRS